MWLRNILGRLRSGPDAPLDLALTVESRPSALSRSGFREFTPPANMQRGGSIRLGGRGTSRIGQFGIIPTAGVKVP